MHEGAPITQHANIMVLVRKFYATFIEMHRARRTAANTKYVWLLVTTCA